MDEQNKILNSWDAFTGDVLKPQNVKNKEQAYVITAVNTEEQDGKTKLKLSLEHNEIKKDFYLNATNTRILMNNADNPKKLVGKKLYCDKMKVNNPQTGSVQDSLVIDKVL